LPSIGAVIWVGMTFLFLVGLVDDFVRIKPQTKLVAQILVASGVAFLGFRLHWFESLTVDTMVTILWIVGITNAFNLLDNMDGLCAGIGCIAAFTLAFIFEGPRPEAFFVAVILAGVLLAFLTYNFNPASIFMGDCGSLQIGFILAVLSLYFAEIKSPNNLANYAVPVMILLVPIFDTILVSSVRILSGRKASVGGRDHTSHRLVLMGFSEKRAVFFLYSVGIVSGLCAYFVSTSDNLTSPVVIAPLALVVLLMGIYLARLRVYPEKEFCLLRERAYTPILIELTYKRQVLVVVLDLGLIAFSYYLSYRLRFSGAEFAYYFKVFLRSLPAVIACKFIAIFLLGVYRGLWETMSTKEVSTYLKASSLGTLLSVVTVTYIYRFQDFSKGIFIIDWLLTSAALLGTRGSFRIVDDMIKRKGLEGAQVLIYGAGRGGEILLREILNNRSRRLKPLGFIDDDRLKAGKSLQGYPVLGTFGDLEKLAAKHRPDGILISFNRPDQGQFDRIKSFCRANRLFLKQFSVTIGDIDLEATPGHEACKGMEN
jgi:UDP-GlcNAc:undecaprenyl-phosphate GlcNAc-1-phosphate transferase